VVQAATNTECL